MKKWFVFLYFLFIAAESFAQKYVLALEPVFGIRRGEIQEALFFDGYFGTDSTKKCSELLWKEDKTFFCGGDLQFAIKSKKDYFCFTNTIYFVLLLTNGSMSDDDWNSAGKKSTSTTFDTLLDKGLDCRLRFSYKKHFFDGFYLSPSISALYSYISYKGKNGRGWYYLDSEEPHYYPDGKKHPAGINYNSTCAGVFTGLELEKDFDSGLKLYAGAEVSPFAFVLACDRHLGSKDYFTYEDYFYTIFLDYNFYIKIEQKIYRNIYLTLSGAVEKFVFTKGEEYYNWDEDSHSTLSSQDAGYSSYKIKFCLGTKIYFSF